jgi:hypothetical protein
MVRKLEQSGQVLVESVLLMTLLVFVSFAIVEGLEEMDFMGGVLKGPWSNMQGMIEAGVFADARQARSRHPGHLDRTISRQND